MEDSMIFMILVQVILIALNAVFASAEIAVISMNDAKLAKMAAEADHRAGGRDDYGHVPRGLAGQ